MKNEDDRERPREGGRGERERREREGGGEGHSRLWPLFGWGSIEPVHNMT